MLGRTVLLALVLLTGFVAVGGVDTAETFGFDLELVGEAQAVRDCDGQAVCVCRLPFVWC